MRNPARIERIINKLRTVWQDSPDMRLGQLLDNLRALVDKNKFESRGVDMFFMEDDLLEEQLDIELADIAALTQIPTQDNSEQKDT